MKTNLRFFTILAGIFFTSLSTHINAATFAFNFSGTIGFSTHPGIEVGTPFTGQVSYADNLEPYADDVAGVLSHPTVYVPIDISFTISGETFTFLTASIQVYDSPPGDGVNPDNYNFADAPTHLTIAGEQPNLFSLTLMDTTGTAIDDESLITSLDALNSIFPIKDLQLKISNGSRVLGFDVQLEPVPIPATAWLFGSGLIGLIGIARRKNV